MIKNKHKKQRKIDRIPPLPFNVTEHVRGFAPGFDLEVERSIYLRRSTSEVDESNFIESNMNRRLMYIHEASLQRIEKTG